MIPDKFEILKSFTKDGEDINRSEYERASVHTIELAMDEFAKQVAIDFFMFSLDHLSLDSQAGAFYISANGKNITEEELFALYLKSKQ